MYTAEYNGQVLHDPRFDDEVIAEATCKLAINTAGSLEISIPPTNPLYNKLATMSAEREVVLFDDGEEVFRGRVTGDGGGINGMQSVTAEGHLAYLNDSVVAPYGTYESALDDDGAREWDTIAPNNRHDYAEWLIAQHNAQTDAYKRYRIGINDLPDVHITRSSTQWPSTKTEITDKLIDDFGCTMSAYMLGGVRYIDFRADGGKDATQTIEFGVNLLDFARTSRAVDAITCIVAIGKDVAGKEFGLGSLPDGPVGDGLTKQGDRILHEAGVTSCGIIVARKSYDVATLDGLVNACCNDLEASQLAVDSIEISATDLHLIDPSIERIRLGEWVFVSARPLKFEARMMCVSIDIDISNPGATKYVLGAELPTLTNGNKTTAARMRKQESALIERMRPIDQTAKDAAIKADTASSTASEAKTTATNASTTATQASSAASAAEAKAATAQDLALAASTKADTANSAAITAQAAASTANNKADTAQSTATTAQTFYAASNTAGGTADKVPASTVAGFSLHANVTLSVKFTYANTAPNPTLNVNGTGAKAIMVDGANAGYWRPWSTLLLTFDGTYWQAVVPVYGSTSTIGNPDAGNVYTDEAGIKVRRGSKVLAEFGDEARVGTTEDAAIYAVVRSDGLHLASQGVDLAALKVIEAGWNVIALDVTSPMQVEGNLNVVGDLYLDAVKMGDFVIARSTAAPWTCTDWASGRRVVEYHGGLVTGALNATGNMYVSNVIEASVPAAMQPLALTGSLICADNDSMGIIGKTTTVEKVSFRVMSWYNTGSLTAMFDMRLTGTWK